MAETPGPFQGLFRRYAGDEFAMRKFTSNVRAFQTVTKLGFTLRAPLVNLTQMLSTMAVVGPRVAIRAIWEALYNSKKWDWLFREARIFHVTGQAEQLMQQQMSKIASFGVHNALYLFQKSERLLRKTAAIAGYLSTLERAGLRGGGLNPWKGFGPLRPQGIKAAQDIIFRTQFHYGSADTPAFMEGPLGAMVGQFKPYLINQMGFLMGLNKKEAFRFFTALGVLAGTGAIPLVEPAEKMMASILGPGFPGSQVFHGLQDLQMKYPRATAGLPGLVAGVNIGQNIGISENFVPTDWMDLLGPTASDVSFLARTSREGGSMTQALASRFGALRSVMQAMRIGEGGMRRTGTADLLYRVEGLPYEHLRGETPAATRRRNIPEITRMMRRVPGKFKRDFARLLPQLREAQQDMPLDSPRLMQLLVALGFTPTGLKAHRLTRRRYHDLLQQYRRGERTGTPVGERVYR
jgi:hypothetical protein